MDMVRILWEILVSNNSDIPGYYGHGYHGYHGYHGKREAHAPVECEKETKEICKKVPIKEDITKDIEFCKGTPNIH